MARSPAGYQRKAQAARLELAEAREAEERCAAAAREADDLDIPDDPDAADFLRNPPADGDWDPDPDCYLYAARTFYRDAKVQVARAEAEVQHADALYYAAVDRMHARRAYAARRPMRLPVRRAPRAPRRARLSAVASAGHGSPEPPEPPPLTRPRATLPGSAHADVRASPRPHAFALSSASPGGAAV